MESLGQNTVRPLNLHTSNTGSASARKLLWSCLSRASDKETAGHSQIPTKRKSQHSSPGVVLEVN